MRHIFQSHYSDLCREQDTVANIAPIVLDKYRYKGGEIERSASRTIRKLKEQRMKIENIYNGKPFFVFDFEGHGELTLLLALMYPERFVYCWTDKQDTRDILEGCLSGFTSNAQIISTDNLNDYHLDTMNVFIVGDIPAYINIQYHSNVIVLH